MAITQTLHLKSIQNSFNNLVILLSSILIFTNVADAYQGEPPLFLDQAIAKNIQKNELVLNEIDPEKIRAEKALTKKSGSAVSKAVEFAVPEDLAITTETNGFWTEVNEGMIWRLSVSAPGATDLNFGFTEIFLPEGATLHVYDPISKHYAGPYTHEHNYAHRQLWTPIIPGDLGIIEVFVPKGLESELVLKLGRVGKGYQDVFNIGIENIEKQGSCNIDVVCSQGNSWRNEIRSVAAYGAYGTLFCTGTLINNVEQDSRPFFLTAAHCDITSTNAPSVVAYWNYESPSCGALSGGSLSNTTSGTTLRARNTANDMTLLEFNAPPISNYNVYYSGWDARTNLNPSGSVAIHHPNVDEKAISFNTNSMTTGSCINSSTNNTHWYVDDWELGTTEPGSSGSGLFDPSTNRLIGYLSGGTASCSFPQGYDCYGKFSVGWSVGLSSWLDPNNTGTLFVDGSNDPALDSSTPPAPVEEDTFVIPPILDLLLSYITH